MRKPYKTLTNQKTPGTEPPRISPTTVFFGRHPCRFRECSCSTVSMTPPRDSTTARKPPSNNTHKISWCTRTIKKRTHPSTKKQKQAKQQQGRRIKEEQPTGQTKTTLNGNKKKQEKTKQDQTKPNSKATKQNKTTKTRHPAIRKPDLTHHYRSPRLFFFLAIYEKKRRKVATKQKLHGGPLARQAYGSSRKTRPRSLTKTRFFRIVALLLFGTSARINQPPSPPKTYRQSGPSTSSISM